jgi:hypothetical protein
LGRLKSCLEITGAGKAKVVQIGHTTEGVHFVTEQREYCIHARRRLENLILVLIGSMFRTSMEHVEMTVHADREHVIRLISFVIIEG